MFGSECRVWPTSCMQRKDWKIIPNSPTRYLRGGGCSRSVDTSHQSVSHTHTCEAAHTHTHTPTAPTPSACSPCCLALHIDSEKTRTTPSWAYDVMTSGIQTNLLGEHAKWSRQGEATRGMSGTNDTTLTVEMNPQRSPPPNIRVYS